MKSRFYHGILLSLVLNFTTILAGEYNIQHYTFPENITNVVSDKAGNLFCTGYNTIWKYENNNWILLRDDIGAEKFHMLHTGDVWVENNSKLHLITGSQDSIIDIHRIMEAFDRDGNLWGVENVNNGEFEVVKYYKGEWKEVYTRGNTVRRPVSSPNGELYIYNDLSTVLKFDGEKWVSITDSLKDYPTIKNSKGCFYPNDNGTYWMTVSAKGFTSYAFYFDGEKWSDITPESGIELPNSVTEIIPISEDEVWLNSGYSWYLLNKREKRVKKHSYKADSWGESTSISSLESSFTFLDDGTKWYHYGSYFYRYMGEATWEGVDNPSFKHTEIKNIAAGENNSLWINYAADYNPPYGYDFFGISHLKKDTIIHYNSHTTPGMLDTISQIYTFNNGDVWLSAYKRLIRLTKEDVSIAAQLTNKTSKNLSFFQDDRKISFDNHHTELVSFKLYTINGRQVYSTTVLTGGASVLSLPESISTGVYIADITSKSIHKSWKIEL